jgi:hypothetical protein
MSEKLVILGGGESGIGSAVLGVKQGFDVFGGVPFIVNGLPTYQFEWTYTPIDVTKSPSKFFGQTLTKT